MLHNINAHPTNNVWNAVSANDFPDVTLEDRHTHELVIALVGPVGAGVTTSARILQDLFEKRYSYSVGHVRVSELIEESANLVGKAVPSNQSRADHIRLFQDIGTALRAKFTQAYLADKCIERIALDRKSRGGYADTDSGLAVAVPRRVVHIIDSLKNPGELDRLRQVYGDTFWVFGVFAPEPIRRQRLENQSLNPVQVLQIIKIDEKEGVKHGQRVSDTIHHADFFVRNDRANDATLRESLQRDLDLLFGVGIHTPTQAENAMYEASSASSKSACLSRQVGAVIYSKAGELIGLGDNDVPKYGGGLYTEEVGVDDHRCHKWGGKICHNDAQKDLLYEAIFKELKNSKLLAKTTLLADVIAAVKATDVSNLIEYSRAVHAEMEAIVSVARGQKSGIVGATMYTTTYPCHNCARHIVASGITKVIYIEPYAKSLATTLHADSISVQEPAEQKVLFLQYEGVAPKNIIKLFNPKSPRKENGHVVITDPSTAAPVLPAPLDGFDRREQIVVAQVVKAEEQARSGEKNPPHGDAKDDAGRRPVELPLRLTPLSHSADDRRPPEADM